MSQDITTDAGVITGAVVMSWLMSAPHHRAQRPGPSRHSGGLVPGERVGCRVVHGGEGRCHRALITADLAYRMEQFADGGVARVLENLHPEIAFANDLLQIDKPQHYHHRFDLAGTGIVLMPCVFTWPTVGVDCGGVDQPVLVYPPRGRGRAVAAAAGRADRPAGCPGGQD